MSCKHACLIHKIIMLCKKAIIGIRVSFTHLSHIVPPQSPSQVAQHQNLQKDLTLDLMPS
jgi:hypothetical protein